MKVNVEMLTSDFISFGKMNCLLFLKKRKHFLESIYTDILILFKPDEINYSSFDLSNLKMQEFDISTPFQDDNSIRKVIFTRADEQVILEYHKGKFIIEHLTKFQDDNFKSGIKVIKKYSGLHEDTVIVCGFELSIDIDDFSQSLDSTKKDGSFHPIIVLTKHKQTPFAREEYASITDKISIQKVEFMNNYIDSLEFD